MSQIESYERPYHIVLGDDGGDVCSISFEEGPDLPIYMARRQLTALIFTFVQKLPEDDPERAELEKIRRTFHDAQGGDLVFGKIMRWTNKKGTTRVIGILEKGQKYTEAGQPRSVRDPNYKPPKQAEVRRYLTVAERLAENDIEASKDRRPRATPQAKQQSEAERIADKMAKAARKAAEGS